MTLHLNLCSNMQSPASYVDYLSLPYTEVGMTLCWPHAFNLLGSH